MSANPSAPGQPRNAIVILLDSLNRHMLGAYGGREFATPILDAFARRAVRFDRHYSGSLPCIPARHDILCGAIDFLWKPWGSIELWERPVTSYLRAAGITAKLVSDHPHLFEVGGENYHTDFTAWDYLRGHEGDPWQTRPDPSWVGAPSFGRGHMPYDNSRGYFRGEDDFPGPRTMAAATKWLEGSARAHDRFMLFIDEFDPHEPFDTPEPYASMYDPQWNGPHLIWPPYMRGAIEHGLITPEQARQIRACYGAKLTMIDAWLGKLLAAVERGGFYNDTAVIICTDHGHYLGEKDIWGKPAVPLYEPLGHTPLLIAWPGVPARSVDALTTNVDICATLADLFGIQIKHRTHGRSMVPLIAGDAKSIRDWAIAGVWGREVHLIGTQSKYARAPEGVNAPLSLWSNRWSTMPIHRSVEPLMPPPDERAALDRMPGSKIPVIRQPYRAGDLLPFWAVGKFTGNHLYCINDDPAEEKNLAGSKAEKDAADKLRTALIEMEAPKDQFERLGLA
ncbi:MAG TPA: sulfatase [Candidatus Binataceae bacterium]|nr:sulfatase [Candidatus Binataceae bacterium]